MRPRSCLPPSLAALALAVLSSCTMPQADEATSAVRYTGDRSYRELDEVVVSVPLAGPAPALHNLHVRVAAIINPREASWSSTSDVADAIAHLEPRISDRIVKLVTAGGALTADTLGALQARIAAEVQAVVDGALARWKHREEYGIEMVVTSLYLTDLSAPVRTESPRMGWMW